MRTWCSCGTTSTTSSGRSGESPLYSLSLSLSPPPLPHPQSSYPDPRPHHTLSLSPTRRRTGIEAYIQGNWPKATKSFELTLELTNGSDGPSKFLLEQIKHDGPEAPSDWPGYREEGGGH